MIDNAIAGVLEATIHNMNASHAAGFVSQWNRVTALA
jgi:hypothetical protein